MYRLIVNRQLLPALGKTPALAVDHARVTELHHSLRATPVMANQVVGTLSRIWNAAENRGLVPEASNPCRLVVKNRERRRERFLSEEEFRRLGRLLAEAETRKGVSVHAVAAIRLLLLTGCRRNEILTRGTCLPHSSVPRRAWVMGRCGPVHRPRLRPPWRRQHPGKRVKESSVWLALLPVRRADALTYASGTSLPVGE